MKINLNVVLLTNLSKVFIIYKIDSKNLILFSNLKGILRIQDQKNNTFDSCKLLVLTSILLISPLIVSYLI
jgi:hypothetical protein